MSRCLTDTIRMLQLQDFRSVVQQLADARRIRNSNHDLGESVRLAYHSSHAAERSGQLNVSWYGDLLNSPPPSHFRYQVNQALEHRHPRRTFTLFLQIEKQCGFEFLTTPQAQVRMD